MSSRCDRWAPLTGVVFVALLIASNVLGGKLPDSNASAAKVISYYNAHSSKVELAAYLTGLSLFFGLFFYASLRDHLRRSPAAERLADTAFGGAVLFAVGGGLTAGTQFALADVPGALSPAAAQALNAISNDLAIFAMLAGVAVLLMASGIAIVRTGVLPLWLGWIAIVVAVIALTPVGFFAFLAAGVWTLVASILVFTRQQGADSATTGFEATGMAPST